MNTLGSHRFAKDSKNQMNWNFDNWVRQLTLSALLLAALALVALGIALYAPHAHANEHLVCSYPSSERTQQ